MQFGLVVVEKQFTEVGSRIWCSRAHGAGAHTVTVHVSLRLTFLFPPLSNTFSLLLCLLRLLLCI
jgi:hypothetical protein